MLACCTGSSNRSFTLHSVSFTVGGQVDYLSEVYTNREQTKMCAFVSERRFLWNRD
ncbi:unnamed protein product [Tenebrio molitor]|nr:unnamed protein product [Tenebrio molitor]